MSRVVVIEDDIVLARSTARLLSLRGFDVEICHDGQGAAARMLEEDIDLLLLDLDIPPPDGWELLARARSLPDPPAVVVVSGNLTIENTVEALRLGASDCIPKGADMDQLADKLQRAIDRLHMSEAPADPLVAESPAMKKVVALVDKVAASPRTPVLVLGESGVGKEVVARRIHERSPRKDGPFVAVNLAALPDTLVEAELFGHRRGAFTGSLADRPGKIEAARGGTVLLDELCEMHSGLQSKLLRVLENRRFFPVGADEEIVMDARVVAATNREPREAIEQGALREDLYYRLSTVVVRVPPLRERPEDVAPLARAFLDRVARERGEAPRSLSSDAEAFLESRSWAGNARELRNLVERTVLLDDGDTLSALSFERALLASRPPGPGDAKESGWDLMRVTQEAVEAVEREQIRHAMRLADGAVGRAAELLGIARTTLWSKLKKYDLGPE